MEHAGEKLVVVDFSLHGNVVRFFLGKPGVEPWGDDWNDAPYEHNAGTVYSEYTCACVDVAFDFDALVAEPCLGHWNSPWSKHDMLERRVACVASALVEDDDRWKYEDWFDRIAGMANAWRVFLLDKVTFGDDSFVPFWAQVLRWSYGERYGD